MGNNVYIFFKSAKVSSLINAMVINVDGVQIGLIKAGEEFKLELDDGKHILEIYMSWYNNKKKFYAKKELNISDNEIYLTYAPPIIFMNGKIKEVTKDKYKKKEKNDKLYAILYLIAAMILYFLLI